MDFLLPIYRTYLGINLGGSAPEKKRL